MKILYFILEAFTFTVIILISIWIYKDAKERKMWALLWAYMALFLPLIGLVIYLFIRAPLYQEQCPDCEERMEVGDIICEKCPYNFKNIAEERGLIPSYKKASLKEKWKAFVTGLKYILKIKN